MDFFLFKKIISVMVMPVNIVLFLLILSLIFSKFKPKLTNKCVGSAAIVLALTALPPFSNAVMEPIESNFESFTHSKRPIDYIIVLGCGHHTVTNMPAIGQLKACSLQRLTEAVRIYRLHPEATLITSGWSANDPTSNAEKVRDAAIELGVPAEKILMENFPKDTEEEAELISPRVKGSNVVLVTNADHMPRAIHYFQLQGVNPIAAPTGFWVKDNKMPKNWAYYVPQSENLNQTSVAWYETLGRIWQWLKS